MAPRLEKPVKLFEMILGIVVTIIGGVITATMAYAGVIQQGANHEKRISDLEKTTRHTYDNVLIIGERLNVGDRMKRD